MSLGFLNLLMLFGLAAVAIPPLIHLLNRRRYDVVDWGAMQFLQVSETTRRRLLIEEILLMLLRMGLIAVLVLALAAPRATSSFFTHLGGRPNRDVVLVVDGSYSMGLEGREQTPHQAAVAWAAQFLDTLAPGDGVAVLHARQQVIPVLDRLTPDRERVRAALGKLSAPRGGCDWPRALGEAARLLQAQSQRAQREVIVLTDGRKHGWADADSLFQWEMLSANLGAAHGSGGGPAAKPPRVWVVNVAADRGDDAPPN